MQKAKKMSKQTLVIAVLAVLLVLSLALSVTGAWFTDTDTDTNSTKIQFGTVSVTATDAAVTVSRTEGTGTKLVPGDKVSVSGKVANASDVPVYIVVSFSGVKALGTTETWSDSLTKDKFTIDITSAIMETGSEIAFESAAATTLGTSVATLTTGEKVYKVSAAAANLAYSGVFTLKGADLGNTITAANGTTYRINAGHDSADTLITGVWFETTTTIHAIQADNIQQTAAVAALEAAVNPPVGA